MLITDFTFNCNNNGNCSIDIAPTIMGLSWTNCGTSFSNHQGNYFYDQDTKKVYNIVFSPDSYNGAYGINDMDSADISCYDYNQNKLYSYVSGFRTGSWPAADDVNYIPIVYTFFVQLSNNDIYGVSHGVTTAGNANAAIHIWNMRTKSYFNKSVTTGIPAKYDSNLKMIYFKDNNGDWKKFDGDNFNDSTETEYNNADMNSSTDNFSATGSIDNQIINRTIPDINKIYGEENFYVIEKTDGSAYICDFSDKSAGDASIYYNDVLRIKGYGHQIYSYFYLYTDTKNGNIKLYGYIPEGKGIYIFEIKWWRDDVGGGSSYTYTKAPSNFYVVDLNYT